MLKILRKIFLFESKYNIICCVTLKIWARFTSNYWIEILQNKSTFVTRSTLTFTMLTIVAYFLCTCAVRQLTNKHMRIQTRKYSQCPFFRSTSSAARTRARIFAFPLFRFSRLRRCDLASPNKSNAKRIGHFFRRLSKCFCCRQSGVLFSYMWTIRSLLRHCVFLSTDVLYIRGPVWRHGVGTLFLPLFLPLFPPLPSPLPPLSHAGPPGGGFPPFGFPRPVFPPLVCGDLISDRWIFIGCVVGWLSDICIYIFRILRLRILLWNVSIWKVSKKI